MNLYSSTKPVMLMSLIFGVTTITTNKKDNNEMKINVSHGLRVYTTIMIILFTFVLVLGITNSTDNKPAFTTVRILSVGFMFQQIGHIASTYGIFVATLATGGYMKRALQEIAAIDVLIDNYFKNVNYKKHFKYELILISLGLTTLGIKAFLQYYGMEKKILEAVPFPTFIILSWSFILVFIVEAEYTMMVLLIKERFLFVNREIKNAAEDNFESQVIRNKIAPIFDKIYINEIQNYKEPVKNIEILMEIHDALTDAGNEINAAFTFQITMCLGIQFLNEIFTLFYSYYNGVVLKNKLSMLNWFTWALVVTVEVLHMTYICHSTSREARNTGTEIHNALVEPYINTMLKEKLMIFSQQVLHKPLRFSACGLFPIDNTLLFTITGSAATYLLVMLQFQEGTNVQCEASMKNRTMIRN